MAGGLGEGYAGPVGQEGEDDGNASNAGAPVDIAAATDQYSSGTASSGTGRWTRWTGWAGK